MLTGKRKRAWYAQLASFPDEKPMREGERHAGKTVAAASLSSAWLRCGDGFHIDSPAETKGCSEKTSGDKKCFTSVFSSREGCLNRVGLSELPDIGWSSSESDLSGDENKTSASPFLKRNRCRRYDFASEDGYDPQFIDWENDSNSEDDVEQCKGSETEVDDLDILDTESCLSCSFISEKEGEPSKISLEISEFSSDSESTEKCQLESEAINVEVPKRFQVSFGDDNKKDTGRSASDWLKSAQTLLQTPKKNTDKSLKTPEDSAKKRKLLRGGLAERLNRLQNRERATVNFWRHQCISHDQTPSGDKTGVLIVKILEMHEECNLCVAVCHQLGQNYAYNFSTEQCTGVQPILKVLFAKETAAHLKLALQDVICVHPPWQKLLHLNENIPVILNTHFSQNIILKESKGMDRPHFEELLLAKRNISLAWIFSLSDREDQQSQITAVNQVSCPCLKTFKTTASQSNSESPLSLFPVSSLSDSLLDIVELQGTAGGKGIQVHVVVQRVYYVFAKEGLRYHLQGNNPSSNTALLLNSGLPNVRLCLLIQDAYGMFSELQFHVPVSVPQIEEHSRTWEGKHCILSGIKILQRVTRGRVFGLFSLIDSLWPPLLPLKVPGRTQENETQVAVRLPPPSFCYILAASADQSYVDGDGREQASDMYFPPAVYSLKEILQLGTQHQCCSFWAQVIYRRLQASDGTPSDQRQFWLFVTDFSLQNMTDVSSGLPKTLPVSVDSLCVIDAEVMETIKSRVPCAIFFKDALCGNGRIICIERTVLLLQRPLLCRVASADITELTGPVKLDELDFATQVNSICTVQGIVSGINEQTAYVWPACSICGNEKVEKHPKGSGSVYCNRCCEAITSPVLKMHLEVFLYCQSRPQCTVKVKLLQKTISLLLESSPTDKRYEVRSVVGKEVQRLYCFVHSVTSHPFSCAVLEEIVLPGSGGS